MSLSFLLLLLLLLLLLRRRRGPPVVLHSNPRPSFVSAQGRSKLEIPYTLRSKKQRVQQIEHDEGKVVKKPSTQPPKQDAYMVVLSRAVPRSCPCPIGAAKFPPPTRRSERRNPFNPRLRRPCMAGRRTDKYFSKSSTEASVEKSRKVCHQVSRDFKKYIEAADYWKRFTTHTNRIGLGKVT